MSESSTVIRGSVILSVLAMLSKKDMYGFEIISEIQRITKSRFSFPASVIYPVLHRLKDKEAVSTFVTLGEASQQSRTYYHLEPAGEEYLKKLMREYKRTTQGFDMIFQYTAGGDREK